MLEALIKLLSSGVTLAPEVIAFINTVRAQSGLTDEQVLAHARTTNDANTATIVARRLQIMKEIAAEGVVANENE